MSRSMVRNLFGATLWSLAALGIWLLTLSAVSWGELLVGTASALVVGVIAVAAQRVVGMSWDWKAVPLRPALLLPFAVTSDALQVLGLSLLRRQSHGHFETMDVDAGGSSPRASTRRALATLGTTVTPASLVVDVNGEGVMTLHSLPTVGIRMEQSFARP